MGAKKPTQRKLPTGEVAIHYPDDRVVLVPQNRMRERVEAAQEANIAAHQEMKDRALAAVAEKRQAQLNDPDPVSPDKTPL